MPGTAEPRPGAWRRRRWQDRRRAWRANLAPSCQHTQASMPMTHACSCALRGMSVYAAAPPPLPHRPTHPHTGRWAQAAIPGFLFHVKAFGLFCSQGCQVGRAPAPPAHQAGRPNSLPLPTTSLAACPPLPGRCPAAACLLDFQQPPGQHWVFNCWRTLLIPGRTTPRRCRPCLPRPRRCCRPARLPPRSPT